jgi:hypothetical protein
MIGFFLRSAFKVMRFWPPYLGAGVRVVKVSKNLLFLRVQMRGFFWNQNISGMHFGGSLYSMVDPFYALLLMCHLGPDYVILDSSASIEYLHKAKGSVFADFSLTQEQVEHIREKAQSGEKIEPHFDVCIYDEKGKIVTKIHKVLYIRKKRVL